MKSISARRAAISSSSRLATLDTEPEARLGMLAGSEIDEIKSSSTGEAWETSDHEDSETDESARKFEVPSVAMRASKAAVISSVDTVSQSTASAVSVVVAVLAVVPRARAVSPSITRRAPSERALRCAPPGPEEQSTEA